MEKKLSEHFTVSEFTYSQRAVDLGIANTPTEDDLLRISSFVRELLEPLRVAWGSPIRISSGFRGCDLNKAIGGSKTSAHALGYAADLVPCNNDMKGFKKFVLRWLQDNRMSYDQYIDERDKKGNEWVHLGWRNRLGQQRKQNLRTVDGKNYYYIDAC